MVRITYSGITTHTEDVTSLGSAGLIFSFGGMGGYMMHKMFEATDEKPFARVGLAVIMTFGVYSLLSNVNDELDKPENI